LKILYKLFGDFTVQSYVKANYLTHDAERIADFQDDPLITRSISVKVLLDLYETANRVLDDASAIQVPTQVLISGTDFVVHRKPQLDFFKRLGSVIKEKQELKGFYHDALGEKDRHLAIDRAREFILKSFALESKQPCLLNADQI